MFLIFLDVFYQYECFSSKYLCEPCVCLVPVRSEKGTGSPGIGLTDGCKPPCRYWESNPGSLNCWAISPDPNLMILFFANSLALWSSCLTSKACLHLWSSISLWQHFLKASLSPVWISVLRVTVFLQMLFCWQYNCFKLHNLPDGKRDLVPNMFFDIRPKMLKI